MNILKRAKNNLVYAYHRKRRYLAVYMMRKIDKSSDSLPQPDKVSIRTRTTDNFKNVFFISIPLPT